MLITAGKALLSGGAVKSWQTAYLIKRESRLLYLICGVVSSNSRQDDMLMIQEFGYAQRGIQEHYPLENDLRPCMRHFCLQVLDSGVYIQKVY